MYSIEDFRQDVRDYVEQDRWMADPDVVIDLFSKLIGTDITLDEATKIAQQEIPNPPLTLGISFERT